MVTLDYIMRAALRLDTSMSRAFLRALGVRVPAPAPSSPVVVSAEAAADIAWCFANHGSPMDGRA